MLIKNGFLFFWRTEDIYSQWHPSTFVKQLGNEYQFYSNAEQYMMAAKAKLFGDEETWLKILETSDPREIKQLGREVRYYNDVLWTSLRYGIVREASFLKFSQNNELCESLCRTGNLVLVEASPYDKIWGVGMAEDHPDITDPSKWQGQNLLGKALMDVRAVLQKLMDAQKRDIVQLHMKLSS